MYGWISQTKLTPSHGGGDMRLRHCEPRTEIDVGAGSQPDDGRSIWRCLASQSHGTDARTGHQFSFHQDRDTKVG